MLARVRCPGRTTEPAHLATNYAASQMISLLARRVFLFAALTVVGCEPTTDSDVEARNAFIDTQTSARKLWLRRFLNGTEDMVFYDGWYDAEIDPATGGAWRWMDRRGIVKMRTTKGTDREGSDMVLTVHGWVP